MKGQKEGEEKRREIVSYLKEEGPSRLWKMVKDLVGEKNRNFKSKQNLIYHLAKLSKQEKVKKHKTGRMSTYFLPGQELTEELMGSEFFFRNPTRLIQTIERAIEDLQEDSMGFENLYTRKKFQTVAGSVYRVVTGNLDELPDFPPKLYPLVYFDRVKDWWEDAGKVMGRRDSEAKEWLIARKEKRDVPGGRKHEATKWELPKDKNMIPPAPPESPEKLLSWLLEVADWLEGHA
jgi:hypothetical protein